MISDKTTGSVPFGAESMAPRELAPHLVRLQGERVALNDEIAGLRAMRDDLSRSLYVAKQRAERAALTTLPPAKGKDEPAASAVKDFVDSDASVLAVKEAQTEAARDLAAADDRLGAVRSGLRVVGALIEVAHRDVDEKTGRTTPTGEDW